LIQQENHAGILVAGKAGGFKRLGPWEIMAREIMASAMRKMIRDAAGRRGKCGREKPRLPQNPV
jgi:hypothetical protein